MNKNTSEQSAHHSLVKNSGPKSVNRIKREDKLGLSRAKLSSAGAKISLVFIGWGYREKYSGCLG